MSVMLTPDQEREVSERVASGKYPSGDAVIRAALAALSDREELEAKRAALRADIDQGIAALDAGLGVPFTRETLDTIKSEGRKRRDGTGHG